MKKLITIVALVTAVLATPAFSKSNGTSNERPGAGNSYQQNDQLDWVHDHAKGYIG
jgi:hypothetical protein